MFGVLLAFQILDLVICNHDNTIKASPYRYINENARSKRSYYIDGIPAEDYGRYMEYERRSAATNVPRPVRSADYNTEYYDYLAAHTTSPSNSIETADNRWDIDDIFLNRDKPGLNQEGSLTRENLTSANNRWDITDLLLNRQKPDLDPKRTLTSKNLTTADNRWDITDILDRYKTNSDQHEKKSNPNHWDITDFLLKKEKTYLDELNTDSEQKTDAYSDKNDRDLSTVNPEKLARVTVQLTPKIWQKISFDKNKTDVKPEDENKTSLRWLLDQGQTQNITELDSDYKDFDVVEYLINDFRSKHPEAKHLNHDPKSKGRHRSRRFNVNQDLLKLQPPQEELILKSRLESPMTLQGSTDELSVKPQLDFTGTQCTKATDGAIDATHFTRDIHMYLAIDQSTGTVHIDTRRVCKPADGLSVKACDDVRPYVFLIPLSKFEFNIMVVRIQPKKYAKVTITISCPGQTI